MHYAEEGRWRLYRGDELLADLVVTGSDFPWFHAQVVARPGLGEVRPLFATELALLDKVDADDGAWDAAYAGIRAAVRLTCPDGRDVPEFLLHIDGDQAWWRWSDEPFDS